MTVLPGEPGRMVRGMRNVTDTLFCLHSARCQMPGHPHSHAYNRTSSRTQGLVLAFPLVSCIPQMSGLASVCAWGGQQTTGNGYCHFRRVQEARAALWAPRASWATREYACGVMAPNLKLTPKLNHGPKARHIPGPLVHV